jgi:hypothetical protein
MGVVSVPPHSKPGAQMIWKPSWPQHIAPDWGLQSGPENPSHTTGKPEHVPCATQTGEKTLPAHRPVGPQQIWLPRAPQHVASGLQNSGNPFVPLQMS